MPRVSGTYACGRGCAVVGAPDAPQNAAARARASACDARARLSHRSALAAHRAAVSHAGGAAARRQHGSRSLRGAFVRMRRALAPARPVAAHAQHCSPASGVCAGVRRGGAPVRARRLPRRPGAARAATRVRRPVLARRRWPRPRAPRPGPPQGRPPVRRAASRSRARARPRPRPPPGAGPPGPAAPAARPPAGAAPQACAASAQMFLLAKRTDCHGLCRTTVHMMAGLKPQGQVT